MMHADEVAVVPSSLLKHAAGIDPIAAQVAQAEQAGDNVRMGGEAYGRLCRMVPLMINSLQDIVVEAIGAADTSLRDTAQRLRQAADRYADADSTGEETIRRTGPVP